MPAASLDTADAVNQRLEREFLSRHGAAAAGMIELLDPAEQLQVVSRHPVDVMVPVWERLNSGPGGSMLAALPEADLAESLRALEPSQIARLLGSLPAEEQSRLLDLAEERLAEEVRLFLDYPPDSAGAMMDSDAGAFFNEAVVSDVLARLRRDRRTGQTGYFVVDGENRLAGRVDMRDIALANPEEKLSAIARAPAALAQAMTSRGEVLEIMDRHHLSELPVIDSESKLAGVIRQPALVEAEREAAVVDMQTMVGVGKDERATSPVLFAVRKRLPWLQVNLLTAFLAAAVVGLFESTIARFTALAVLLPVVAGQSGNSGAQALAVTMRGLALREIRVTQWRRSVLKESGVGLFNGVAVALTTAAGVYLWSHSAGLAAIIAISMVLSMVIAGIAGAGIPILLTKFGQDPAQSSSILLTTVTDIVAFFSFLGIATLLAGLI